MRPEWKPLLIRKLKEHNIYQNVIDKIDDLHRSTKTPIDFYFKYCSLSKFLYVFVGEGEENEKIARDIVDYIFKIKP